MIDFQSWLEAGRQLADTDLTMVEDEHEIQLARDGKVLDEFGSFTDGPGLVQFAEGYSAGYEAGRRDGRAEGKKLSGSIG